MPNVVWILGSGFSKPLGGPTLADLFAPEGEADIRARYRDNRVVADVTAQKAIANVLGEAALEARLVYNFGTRWARGVMYPPSNNGQHLWDDAEQFLDVLETAAIRVSAGQQSVAAERMVQILKEMHRGKVDVTALRNAARRMLAVECSAFLLEADKDSERWEPYRRWCKVLRGADSRFAHTIITFNYDRVLETLGMQDWVRLPPEAAGGGPCILKLHGSVDWRRSGTSFELVDDPHFPAVCDDTELSIAPPGPAKEKIASEFEPLWRAAEARLREASAVVFLGYRFPPTDAAARRRILDAIPRDYCTAHVVLGPHTHQEHVARMRGLLEFRANGSDVRVHPLWVEDFIGIFEQTVFPG